MNDFKDLFERIKVEHYAKHSKESEILNLNLSYGRKQARKIKGIVGMAK